MLVQIAPDTAIDPKEVIAVAIRESWPSFWRKRIDYTVEVSVRGVDTLVWPQPGQKCAQAEYDRIIDALSEAVK